MFVSQPTRGNTRNGAQARKWILAQNYNIDVAASDPSTDEATLLDIVANASSIQIALVAANQGASANVLSAIMAGKPNEDICKRLSMNPSTPGSVLAELSTTFRNSHAQILSNLAANPNLPTDILVTMLPNTDYKKDNWVEDFAPYKQAAMNPSAPVVEVMKSLPFMKTDELRLKVLSKRGREIITHLNQAHGITLSSPSATQLYRAAVTAATAE